MRTRIIGSKRAITPVLSSLLLTVIAVAAMSIATTATYVITTNLRENMSERLMTEDVWFISTPEIIAVYLRNVGKVAVQVSSAYVNHTSRPFDGPFRLEVGQHRWLNISLSWTAEDLYFIDIITVRGTHVAAYYKAP